MDEFVLPMAILRRHRGALPDDIDPTVKASWATGDDMYYTVSECKPDEIKVTYALAVEWIEHWPEFDNGTRLEVCTNYDGTHHPQVTYNFLKARKPSFQFGDVMYSTEYGGFVFTVYKKRAGLRPLREALIDLLGRDDDGQVRESGMYKRVAWVIEVCDKVSDKVADAVVEMSTYEGERHGGMVEGANHPDTNLQQLEVPGEQFHGRLTAGHDEIVDRCRLAGIECTTPVFSIGMIGTGNIWVDEHYNFVGFPHHCGASFGPRDWVQAQFIDTDAALKDFEVDLCYSTPYIYWGEESGLWNIATFRNMWRDMMSRKLAERGFRKLDLGRFTWRREDRT